MKTAEMKPILKLPETQNNVKLQSQSCKPEIRQDRFRIWVTVAFLEKTGPNINEQTVNTFKSWQLSL